MLRVVIDTSSLISYVLTRGDPSLRSRTGLMRRVVAHWRTGTFTLLSSPATRAELADVLARPAIRQLATAPLDELVRGLERFTEHVPGVLDLAGVCRDAKACGEPGRTNDKFLACAVEGGAHYLVSSDSDLLDMRRYGNVAIINPGQFLLALELYSMEVTALAARFGHDVLADIQATVPLEPETAARVAEALRISTP
jgi:predicted nucleic acid-binding protein